MFMLFALGVLSTASAENHLSKKASKHQKCCVADEPTLRILVVGEFSTMRRIEVNLLKQLGYQNIDQADDGPSALNQLQQNPDYGLVLTDWNMEGMSGLVLLKEIRASENTKNLPSSW